jgi:hypothetical protein
MDCRTAQMLASFVSPNKTELDADQVAALESHLRMCPQCGKLIYAERQFDRKVSKAMKSIVVPAGLKQQILDRIKPQIPWYARTAWQATLATAAALLIGVWFIIAGSGKVSLTQGIIANIPPTQERAMKFLDANGFSFNPKDHPFNMRLLAFYGLLDLVASGPQTPVLFFIREGHWAMVYIVSRRDYRWDELPEEGLSFGGIQFEKIEDANNEKKQVYLIFYTTQDLKPFLLGGSGPRD